MESYSLTHDILSGLLIFISSGLFIDEIKHGLINVVFAAVFYYLTKSKKYSFLVFIITYLIDSDHLFDYFLFYGFDFQFSRFLELSYFEKTRRAVVPFHAWEWVIAFTVLATQQLKKDKKYLSSALAVGMTAHLIWDMLTVKSFIFYSILYRISQHFIVIQ